MARTKTLKCVNMVRINGEFVAQEDMAPEEFSRIMNELAIKAMKTIGYVPVEKKKDTA